MLTKASVLLRGRQADGPATQHEHCDEFGELGLSVVAAYGHAVQLDQGDRVGGLCGGETGQSDDVPRAPGLALTGESLALLGLLRPGDTVVPGSASDVDRRAESRSRASRRCKTGARRGSRWASRCRAWIGSVLVAGTLRMSRPPMGSGWVVVELAHDQAGHDVRAVGSSTVCSAPIPTERSKIDASSGSCAIRRPRAPGEYPAGELVEDAGLDQDTRSLVPPLRG